MQCQEKMDKASEKLSRARSALSLATKAGMEATMGELLDMIAAALEGIDDADSLLHCEDSQRQTPPQGNRGLCAPGALGLELVQNQPRVVPLASAISAS